MVKAVAVNAGLDVSLQLFFESSGLQRRLHAQDGYRCVNLLASNITTEITLSGHHNNLFQKFNSKTIG